MNEGPISSAPSAREPQEGTGRIVASRGLSPKILVDEALTDGMAILAAAHAGLAWYLGCGPEERPLVSFKTSDCSRHSASELQQQKQSARYLSLTESALGHMEVAIVGGCHQDAIAPQHRKAPEHPCTLKMYILVDQNAPLQDAMAAAANAAILCFARHEHLPETSEWVNSSFRKVVCRASESDFVQAMRAENCAAVPRESSSLPRAVAFSPRPVWPKQFQFFRLYR